jgi:hypothetical protein
MSFAVERVLVGFIPKSIAQPLAIVVFAPLPEDLFMTTTPLRRPEQLMMVSSDPSVELKVVVEFGPLKIAVDETVKLRSINKEEVAPVEVGALKMPLFKVKKPSITWIRPLEANQVPVAITKLEVPTVTVLDPWEMVPVEKPD